MPTLSRYVRAAIETRSLRMLRTLSTSPTLRAQMEAYGYSKADHDDPLWWLSSPLQEGVGVGEGMLMLMLIVVKL